MDIESSNLMDIYFDDKFPLLYEKIEKGKRCCYQYKSKYGEIHHNFIIRPIPQIINGKQYHDAVTPYGYGGPIIYKLNTGCGLNIHDTKANLLNGFYDDYKKYCMDNSIVSEFVRFHPLFDNASDFKYVFDVEYLRNVVGTDIKRYPDFMSDEYTRSCRKNIRQCLKHGIEVEIKESPDSLEEFKAVYYSTMKRNHASDYYYFDDEYFSNCLKYYKENILLVKAIYDESVIAAGMYFIWKDIVHIHLSGTLSEYLYLSPAYMLRYAVTKWGVEHQYRIIYHGGGRSNLIDDSLYQFKKQFGKNTEFKFYIGKKIWNEKIYAELCKDASVDNKFFPAYRQR